jgi:hypothetical protein
MEPQLPASTETGLQDPSVVKVHGAEPSDEKPM